MAHGRVQAREGWSLTLNSLELVSSDVDTTLLSRFWPPPPPTIGLGQGWKSRNQTVAHSRSNQKGTVRRSRFTSNYFVYPQLTICFLTVKA